MSDLQMQQEDHPAHNVPTATEHHSGDVIWDVGDDMTDLNRGQGPTKARAENPAGEAIQDAFQGRKPLYPSK